jgi:hypothetical protein
MTFHRRYDLDRHTARLGFSCLSISPPVAHAPLLKGRPSDNSRGRSMQREIRHHSTNYITKTPGSITILGYVVVCYQNGLYFPRDAHELFLYALAAAKCKKKSETQRHETEFNISQMTGHKYIICYNFKCG